MRNATLVVSLLNGYWASQVAGNDHKNWLPVAGAMLSAWACYFSFVWLIQGLRSK